MMFLLAVLIQNSNHWAQRVFSPSTCRFLLVGAIYVPESTVYFRDSFHFAHNVATTSGGEKLYHRLPMGDFRNDAA